MDWRTNTAIIARSSAWTRPAAARTVRTVSSVTVSSARSAAERTVKSDEMRPIAGLVARSQYPVAVSPGSVWRSGTPGSVKSPREPVSAVSASTPASTGATVTSASTSASATPASTGTNSGSVDTVHPPTLIGTLTPGGRSRKSRSVPDTAVAAPSTFASMPASAPAPPSMPPGVRPPPPIAKDASQVVMQRAELDGGGESADPQAAREAPRANKRG